MPSFKCNFCGNIHEVSFENCREVELSSGRKVKIDTSYCPEGGINFVLAFSDGDVLVLAWGEG